MGDSAKSKLEVKNPSFFKKSFSLIGFILASAGFLLGIFYQTSIFSSILVALGICIMAFEVSMSFVYIVKTHGFVGFSKEYRFFIFSGLIFVASGIFLGKFLADVYFG